MLIKGFKEFFSAVGHLTSVTIMIHLTVSDKLEKKKKFN